MATLKTVTVKASGGDYTSLDAAFAGEAADISSATGSDQQIRIDCYPFEDNVDCIIDDIAWKTETPDNYVELRFLDSGGDPFYTSTWSTSGYRLVGKSEVFENNQVNHLWHTEGTFQIMDDLGTSTATFGIMKCSVVDAGGWNRFDGGGILIANHNSGTGVRGFKVDRDMVCRWRNWIAYGGDKETVFSPVVDVPPGSGGPDIFFDSCTFDNWTTLNFVQDGATTLTHKNCRATNIRFDISDSSFPDVMDAASDFNITDREAASDVNWGANSIDSSDSPTIDYVDDTHATFTSRNYELNSSSDSGYEVGLDQSSNFPNDIKNATRTVPWDMGAHELSIAAAVNDNNPKPHLIARQAIVRASVW